MSDSYITALILLLLAFGLCTRGASEESPLEPSSVTLDSGKVRLSFQVLESKLVLKSLSDDTGTEWINPAPQPSSLWSITFLDPSGKKVTIPGNAADISDIKQTRDAATFRWKTSLAGTAAEISMKVRIEEGNPISYWSMGVTLPDGWKVDSASFPMLPDINATENLRMAAPAGWGIEYLVDPETHYNAIYPSCSCSMQFLALYSEGNGLYIGTHDPKANHKVFDAKSVGDGRLSYECTNWPAIPAAPEHEYRVPYEAAIGTFHGDYLAAAEIYREFSFHTPWGKTRSLRERHIPEWLTKNDLWLRPMGAPEESIKDASAAMDFFKMPIALHWYYWHQIPYDTLYPDYFPPKEGFEKAVKDLQHMGFRVMPYINGRLCDPNSNAWKNEGAADWALQGEDGKPYTEIYGSKVPLNAMCPYTNYWHKKITGITGRLFDEYKVNGVYIDQIAAAYACRCFNPSHGHPIGGGHFWVDGYRKLLEDVRKQIPKDHMITTEENTECWIDQFDALLLVNTPTGKEPPIPLFPAVYSGRAITFGSFYMQQEDLDTHLPFRLKVARQMLWGAQLGWAATDQVIAPGAVKEAEFLRNLARTRSFIHDYLAYGRFMGMLSVAGDNPSLTGEGVKSFGDGMYPIETPSVLASEWRADDGRTAIIVVSLSDSPRDIKLNVRIPSGKLAGIKQYTESGLTTTPAATEAGLQLTIPARSSTAITF